MRQKHNTNVNVTMNSHSLTLSLSQQPTTTQQAKVWTCHLLNLFALKGYTGLQFVLFLFNTVQLERSWHPLSNPQ